MLNKCLKYFYANQFTLISIEGNIGSGKSTLLKLMQEKYPKVSFCSKQLFFLPEPVNEWQMINGDPNLNLLGSFYENPQRWAYTMQVYAFYSRLRHWKTVLSSIDSNIILSERSIQADKEIFAINGYQNGLINKLEFALYEKFYDWLVGEIFGNQIKKQMIIYLQVNPEICHSRMLKRSRSEEKNTIALEYMQQIHHRHEEWLVQNNLGIKNAEILIIDGNKEFETDENQQKMIFNNISNFLKGLV